MEGGGGMLREAYGRSRGGYEEGRDIPPLPVLCSLQT